MARLPRQVSVSLPDEVIDALQAEAETEYTSVSAIVRHIVMTEFRRRQEAAA